MLTSSLASCYLGFYFFYSTSKRAVLKPKNKLQLWIATHTQHAKIVGSLLLCISFFLCCLYLGFSAGTYSFLVIFMTIASLIIILEPLRFYKPAFLVILAAVLFVVELIEFSYAR